MQVSSLESPWMVREDWFLFSALYFLVFSKKPRTCLEIRKKANNIISKEVLWSGHQLHATGVTKYETYVVMVAWGQQEIGKLPKNTRHFTKCPIVIKYQVY